MCQFPDHPAVQCSCIDPSALNLFFYSGNIFNHPFDLRCTEICICNQTRFFKNHIAIFFSNCICFSGSSSVLPYDRIVHRNTRHIIPQDYRLPLIIKSHTGNIIRVCFCNFQCHFHTFKNFTPDFHRVMFYPSRLRIILGMFFVTSRCTFPIFIQ